MEGRAGEGKGERAHLLRTAGEMSVRGAKNVCDRGKIFLLHPSRGPMTFFFNGRTQSVPGGASNAKRLIKDSCKTEQKKTVNFCLRIFRTRQLLRSFVAAAT